MNRRIGPVDDLAVHPHLAGAAEGHVCVLLATGAYSRRRKRRENPISTTPTYAKVTVGNLLAFTTERAEGAARRLGFPAIPAEPAGARVPRPTARRDYPHGRRRRRARTRASRRGGRLRRRTPHQLAARIQQ